MVQERAKRSSDLVDLIVDQWTRELPDLDVSSVNVLGRLHRCDIRYQAMVSAVLEEFNLSTAAFDVLASLRRSSPDYRRTAGQLAQIGLISSGGLTQRIDRLERSGLVRRVRDANDRRVVDIELTDEGRSLIDTVLKQHFAEQNRFLVGLTRSEQKQLSQLLSKLEVSLEVAERLRADSDPTPAEPGSPER
ncbi:MarR family winged helix-turn-helix transcriptional regulator [Demetria terragena]|uniref:MarR family winged helix-turn-helix transcriptional regulator n=1 Tax=Demetria terragena TaxID=63959 RepID=UPI00036A7712|nr:MarR family transcriptional regulator [Demetria terragena]